MLDQVPSRLAISIHASFGGEWPPCKQLCRKNSLACARISCHLRVRTYIQLSNQPSFLRLRFSTKSPRFRGQLGLRTRTPERYLPRRLGEPTGRAARAATTACQKRGVNGALRCQSRTRPPPDGLARNGSHPAIRGRDCFERAIRSKQARGSALIGFGSSLRSCKTCAAGAGRRNASKAFRK
jgi:hypothetical protein